MTKDQLNSVRYIAHFADCLLRSRMTERSNSVRARLFHVFNDAVAYHRSEIPEFRYLADLLRETGPFDGNEARFRFAIKTGLQLIGRSPALSEIAGTIRRLAVDAHTERTFELCLDALVERGAKRDEDEKLLVLIKGALAENEINDFFDSLSPKSEERKRRAEMVDKAINEALAEFREKHGVAAAQ